MHYQSMIRIAVLVFLLHCLQIPLQAQKSLSDKLEGAAWIAAKENQVIADSLMYLDHPAPLFRKDFAVTGKLRKATLTITAAGYYLCLLYTSDAADE